MQPPAACQYGWCSRGPARTPCVDASERPAVTLCGAARELAVCCASLLRACPGPVVTLAVAGTIDRARGPSKQITSKYGSGDGAADWPESGTIHHAGRSIRAAFRPFHRVVGRLTNTSSRPLDRGRGHDPRLSASLPSRTQGRTCSPDDETRTRTSAPAFERGDD